jgi:hypothetical protein
MCICKFLSKLFRREKHMAAIDASVLSAIFDAFAATIQKVSAEVANAPALQAELDAEKVAHAADKAALDQANADLAASQASITDLEAKANEQLAALNALLPPAA